MASPKALTALFLMLVMAAAASAASYTVGDSIGWTIPDTVSAYTTWAASKTFRVNDQLVFNFATGMHTVVKVSKKEYDACTSANPIESYANGPATVTLNSTGAHYYLCSIGQHCSFGQKIAINVVSAASSPPPSKSPSASPPTAKAPSTLATPPTTIAIPPAKSPAASSPSSPTAKTPSPLATPPTTISIPPAKSPVASPPSPATSPASPATPPSESPLPSAGSPSPPPPPPPRSVGGAPSRLPSGSVPAISPTQQGSADFLNRGFGLTTLVALVFAFAFVC